VIMTSTWMHLTFRPKRFKDIAPMIYRGEETLAAMPYKNKASRFTWLQCALKYRGEGTLAAMPYKKIRRLVSSDFSVEPYCNKN
jgi:hypothetical protein